MLDFCILYCHKYPSFLGCYWIVAIDENQIFNEFSKNTIEGKIVFGLDRKSWTRSFDVFILGPLLWLSFRVEKNFESFNKIEPFHAFIQKVQSRLL